MSFVPGQEHDGVARQLRDFNEAVQSLPGSGGSTLFERRRIDSIHSRNSSLCSENAFSFPAQPGPSPFAGSQPMNINPHAMAGPASDAAIVSPDFANALWPSNPSLSLDTTSIHHSSRNSVSRYGQYTPPEDGQSKAYGMEQHGDMVAPSIHSASMFGAQKPIRRRLSSASIMDEEVPATAPQPPKKRRRRSTKAANSEEDQKREEFLARNREAASKSRQKKKEWTKTLEETMRNLTAENSHLKYTVSALKEEIINMKTMCLAHVDCSCTAIRDYMNRALEGQVTQSASRQSLMAGQQSMQQLSPIDQASHAAPRSDSVTSPSVVSDEMMNSPLVAGTHNDGAEPSAGLSSATPQLRQTASPSIAYEDFEDRKVSLADVLLNAREDEMMWNDTCGDDYITGGGDGVVST